MSHNLAKWWLVLACCCLEALGLVGCALDESYHPPYSPPSYSSPSGRVIMIRSVPDRAEVTIDGRHIGATPMPFRIGPGERHDLVVEKRGALSKRVHLDDSAPDNYVVTLLSAPEVDEQVLSPMPDPKRLEDEHRSSPSNSSPSGRVIMIRSVPDRAEVTIDGRHIGATPIPFRIGPGERHDLLLEKNGQESKRTTLDDTVSDELVITLLASPEPIFAHIPVETPNFQQLEDEPRGVGVKQPPPSESIRVAGDYWALIIGIDKYRHVTPLDTAVRDATAVRDTLIKKYGFTRERVIELLNEKATRANIEDALFQLSQQAEPEDSVFIYYAGHGQIDLKSQRGYWVPVEGLAQSPGTFVSNARIRDDLSAMQARHVYLVADSCFSGTLFAKTRTLPPLNDKFFARLYETKSRWGLTSGMNEPVADGGKDGHSVFAYFFLKLLNENDQPYLIPSQIYDRLAPLVSRNADQQPRSQPLQGAGDEGGQFVFRLVAP